MLYDLPRKNITLKGNRRGKRRIPTFHLMDENDRFIGKLSPGERWKISRTLNGAPKTRYYLIKIILSSHLRMLRNLAADCEQQHGAFLPIFWWMNFLPMSALSCLDKDIEYKSNFETGLLSFQWGWRLLVKVALKRVTVSIRDAVPKDSYHVRLWI
ncbi:hypothetical protein CEXT_333561 [Caerostris extrusa]|uniref:Uncharacterized protein n=1 Tax=Caerostris extrusa TaxID=172846 RepID=A0AAV4NA94_CAEEX|nr:hypothetical protein CEXT_333561 [Caerostris extrusa]